MKLAEGQALIGLADYVGHRLYALVTLHAVYLPNPRIEISLIQGLKAIFAWPLARNSVVGRMCTAMLIHDTEIY